MKAEASQVEEVLNCLARHHEWSKQTINGSTSFMMLSKNVNGKASSVLKNFKTKESSSLFEVLGSLFLCSKVSRSKSSGEVVEKIKEGEEGWKLKVLSQAARSCLMISIIASVRVHAMPSLSFPFSVCDEIDRCYFEKFWWRKSCEKNKLFLKC